MSADHELDERRRPDATSSRTPRAPIVAGSIGNMMEWYDFGVYAYFAAVISEVFFPTGSAALLLALATFGVGFLMRPLGGIAFGYLGDRIGRRNTLTVSVSLMAVSTFLIGVVPSYAAIGLASPALLVALRLVQGFSVGGEYAGSTSFLVEYASPRRRGLVGSWQSVSVFLSLLAGSGMGVLITSALSEGDVRSYGWRIPFLVGIALGAAGLYLRLRVEDTPEFRALKGRDEVSRTPLRDAGRNERRAMATILGLALLFTVAYYVLLTYIPTYLSAVRGFPLSFSLTVTSIGLGFAVVLVPLVGLLSDFVGRKPLLLTSAAVFLVASYPLFAMVGTGSKPLVIVAVVAFMVPLSLLYGAAPTTFAELLPTRVRYLGFSVPYNVATALFGGFAPFIATLLVDGTGNRLAPSFYLIAAAVVGFLTILTIEETARKPLR